MERKTINQNKLQTLLCIVALTLGVLVSAVLFCMLPVHAAEAKEYEYTVIIQIVITNTNCIFLLITLFICCHTINRENSGFHGNSIISL